MFTRIFNNFLYAFSANLHLPRSIIPSYLYPTVLKKSLNKRVAVVKVLYSLSIDQKLYIGCFR